MYRKCVRIALGAVVAGALAGPATATTREVAELEPVRLSFGQSILNQLTFNVYRDPFDELQTRPYNLLFSNIGRHANLSPWQGQAGTYTRYFNALIGNNGTANVDNDSDSIQGSLIRRETPGLAWGVAGAFLSGNEGSSDTSGSSAFQDTDDLGGVELRGAVAKQFGDRRVLGAGIRITSASSELSNGSFDPGTGGFFGTDEFNQTLFRFDVGARTFLSENRSWEILFRVGAGTSEQDEFSESLDTAGQVTDRFTIANYDLSDIDFGLSAGYNSRRPEGLGETEYRISIDRRDREFDNNDLAFTEGTGGVTPDVTLLAQDAIGANTVALAVKHVFPAGETQMFGAADLAYTTLEGATRIDASGTIVNEVIDDSELRAGLTVGLRQPFFHDRLRFIVSGRADLVNAETSTVFDTGADTDDSSRSTAQYAIGVEGVLANVTFDVAWLFGEESPVIPVTLGLPGGSRRTVDLDRLVFSAAVAW